MSTDWMPGPRAEKKRTGACGAAKVPGTCISLDIFAKGVCEAVNGKDGYVVRA
jgi:hypothetical protein